VQHEGVLGYFCKLGLQGMEFRIKICAGISLEHYECMIRPRIEVVC
jgi:hypothetical protein